MNNLPPQRNNILSARLRAAAELLDGYVFIYGSLLEAVPACAPELEQLVGLVNDTLRNIKAKAD